MTDITAIVERHRPSGLFLPDECGACMEQWPCDASILAAEVERWRRMYLTAVTQWGFLCDLAGAQGDDAPHEVVNAILADPAGVRARWDALGDERPEAGS